jgi:hypothetical protein
MPSRTFQCRRGHCNAVEDISMPSRTLQCHRGHCNAIEDIAMPSRTLQCRRGHFNAVEYIHRNGIENIAMMLCIMTILYIVCEVCGDK